MREAASVLPRTSLESDPVAVGTSALFSSFFPCIGLIGKSMPLAYRESAGGLYEISAHLVAYVVTDAPV